MLKAIHAQESKKAAREKAKMVVEELCAMKLKGPPEKFRMVLRIPLRTATFPASTGLVDPHGK